MTTVPLNEKASRLIQYINELSQIKQTPVASYKNYEQVIWVSSLPESSDCKDAFRHQTEDWLYVKKPIHPTAPVIPEEMKEWLLIDDKKRTLTVHTSITKKATEDNEIVEQEVFIDESQEMKGQIEHFKATVWDPFVLEATRAQEIQALYDKIFKMHQNLQLNSESLELVISTGLLHWNSPSKKVERHLLTSRAELQFNKEQDEFVILPSSKGKMFEYEEDMLFVEDRLSGEDSKVIHNLMRELNHDEQLITQIDSILQSIVHALDSQGTYNYNPTSDIPPSTANVPTVSLSPAFVLRKKTEKSFQKACQTAIEQLATLKEDAQIPTNIANMFLSTPLNEKESAFNEGQEFYFPLPSNEEQNRIISTLNHRSSVLVQSPPGTGKTQTIANLTSHLLAAGQKVLITSQTAKALDVLKSTLPTELQDLSVSLLGGDSASMKEFEKVVNAISVNKERFNLSKMNALVSTKENLLKNLKTALNTTKTEIMEIRDSETYVHHFNSSYKGTAQQIAEKVNKQASAYNWYTSNVTFDTSNSFWKREKNLVNEYIRIRNIKIEVPNGYEEFEYPSIDSIPDVNVIPKVIKEENHSITLYKSLKQAEDKELQQYLKNLSPIEKNALKSELDNFKEIQRSLLFNSYPSLKTVISDIFSNRGYVWEEIIQKSSFYSQIVKENQDKFDDRLIDCGNVTTAVLKNMAEDLQAHINSGGNLGNILVKPRIVRKYKDQLKQVTYNGLAIKSPDQINILHAYAQTKYAKEHILQLLIPSFLSEDTFNISTSFSEVQNALFQLKEALHIQQWRNNILQKYSFLSSDLFTEEMPHALEQNMEILTLRNNIISKTNFMEGIIRNINAVVNEQAHPLYKQLVDCILRRNGEMFHTNFLAYKRYQEAIQRDNLLNRVFTELKRESPNMAMALEKTYNNTYWNPKLTTWQQAFEWKQAQHWIYRFSMKKEDILSEKYDEIEKNIKNTIIEIGTTKAWISMLSALTDSQSKHLKAWAKAVKSIGKGTGKNVPRYRADAQKYMEQCMDAIPAWIMPLHQVYDNFEIRPNLFDVVIIDEASQSWHDALLLKYLAKKLIIVGDDKQTSPTIVGVTDEDILKLQNKYFQDIQFQFGKSLNLKPSFFDIAYSMLKDTIPLQEHFTCMPEIIGFSNLISYQDKPLLPLRQYPSNRLEPIKSLYLPNGVREGASGAAYNEVEADAIVQEIKSCIKNPRYVGKTFGVISLLGDNQAKIIQNKLLSELGSEIMEERKIICGAAYAFQGDERDIVFLSMVVAKGTSTIKALTDDKARQRFNVAVSRAKDQLWLMHSITVNDISNRDCLRYQLLSYIANPLKEETEYNRAKCESKFECDVFDAITSKGYRVIPQYNAANYKIDLVVQGEKSKLAVECDGDTSAEDRERDFLQERVLQRAGWTFWRVLGSTYYNNPKKALESLWVKIEEMGIRPYSEWQEEPIGADVQVNNVELKTKVANTRESLVNKTSFANVIHDVIHSYTTKKVLETLDPLLVSSVKIINERKNLNSQLSLMQETKSTNEDSVTNNNKPKTNKKITKNRKNRF